MSFILVGCEESQSVTIELRKLGHNDFSCDLEPCSGGHPEWHLQMDVFKAISGGSLKLESGEGIFIGRWDGCVFHPTCTFLTNAGVRWLYNKDKTKNMERWGNLELAITFFNNIIAACEKQRIFKYAIENPIPHKWAVNGINGRSGIGVYDQCIHPYHFGHLEKKGTCFWLSGLKPLTHTNNVYKEMMKLEYKDRAKIHYASPGPNRAKIRSKTYTGIAKAMAEQWFGKA